MGFWDSVALAWPYANSLHLLQTDNHTNTSPLNFYRPDALPDAQPTVSKHWRHKTQELFCCKLYFLHISTDHLELGKVWFCCMHHKPAITYYSARFYWSAFRSSRLANSLDAHVLSDVEQQIWVIRVTLVAMAELTVHHYISFTSVRNSAT